MTVETSIGKITASKEVLNWISMFLCEAEDSYSSRNFEGCAKMAGVTSRACRNKNMIMFGAVHK